MSSSNTTIYFDEPSQEVQIHLPDGRVLSGPRGATVLEFLELLMDEGGPQIVGAVINRELRELTYPISVEAEVIPVTMGTADGMRIYRRSLTMLLETSFVELFSGSAIIIDHSVSHGGYFCRIVGRPDLNDEEIALLKSKMQELMEADLPFEKKEVPIGEAIEYFRSNGQEDKVRLLNHRKKDYLVLYYFRDNRDYLHGYMVPSSGYLKWFDIAQSEGGFTLRFPRRHDPHKIHPLGNYPQLLNKFREYGDWLERLGLESVGSLNDAILDGRIREVILVSEALQEQGIADIANQISESKDQIRVVLIAGPSSSGKTTTARRLSVQMLASGIHPFPLELDNFFVDREDTPIDEFGKYDFEHIDAIDRPRLNDALKKCINGEEVQFPKYDFKTGTSVAGDIVKLNQGQIVIVEGIHGLNPDLLTEIPDEQIFRIYLSALTQLNLDHHNRVSTTDTRLLRRIVRDSRTRGYTPQQTIQRWDSVRRGEKKYIFPFQEKANLIFNSALVYELAALKSQAEPLLRQVPFGTPEHIEVKRLLALLEWVLPLDTSMIPDNSLIREFIGGSILSDFKLWKNPND